MEQRPVYPNIKQAVVLCFYLIFFNVIAATALYSMYMFISGQTDLKTNPILDTITYVFPAIFVIYLGWTRTRRPLNEVFRFRNIDGQYFLPVVIVIIGLGIVASELDNVVRSFYPPPPFIQEWFKEIYYGGFLMSLFVVFFGPIIEELLFRGIILNGFLMQYSVKKSIIASSILFMAFHLNPYQFAGSLLAGLFLAWLYVATRNLTLCVFAHAFNNFLPYFVGRFLKLEIPGLISPEINLDLVEFQPLWIDIMGGFLLVTGFFWLKQRVNETQTKSVEYDV